MSETRIATRYAKSLLELAVEQNRVEDVYKDMLSLTKVCSENHQLVRLLRSPVVRNDKKRSILKAIFKQANPLTLAIFDIISKKKREAYLPAIAKAFHRQYNTLKGIDPVAVTTAVPLGAPLRKEIEQLATKISTLDKIELTEKVDPEIIGGYILKVGDRQIDDSLRSKLMTLNYKLRQNPYVKEF